MNKCRLFSILIGYCIAVNVQAHDTTHIHPMITKRVFDLIKQDDLNNEIQGVGVRIDCDLDAHLSSISYNCL